MIPSRPLIALLPLLGPLLLPAAGEAAEIPVESRITAVTVFRDRAEVTRSFTVTLPAGAHTAVIEGLPANLISDSLRVSGQAVGELLLGSVESRQRFAEVEVREEERRLRSEVEALRDRRRALQDRIAAARLTLELMGNLARSAPQTGGQTADGRLDPKTWEQAFATLQSGSAQALEHVRLAEIDTRALDRQIGRAEQELQQIRTGRRALITVRINLEAGQATEAELALSYQLPGAAWRPSYEARLNSRSGRTELIQMAEVRQRTGEDWSGVGLTLSTAQPSVSALLPELDTWFLDFQPPVVISEVRKRGELQVQSLDTAAPAAPEGAPAAEPSAKPKEAKAQTAEVAAGEFAAQYRIPGPAEVPADNAPQRFVIAEHAFDAKLAALSVPKRDPSAYLFGALTYEGAAPLLAGPVTVFRDGAFVGRSAIELLRPGEEVKLAFGIDDKVRIDYRFETGERTREGIINKRRREERRYIITVANHHERPLEITVLDQLPVPRDEEIEVEMLTTTTRPSEENFEDRKGVLAWRDDYEPGEEQTIRFGYRVSFPEGRPPAGF